MYKTKCGVSLRPNCFKSSPRSPAPQLSAQIFNCPVCSAVRWCSGTTSESLWVARWGPSAGGGLWPGLVAAGRECVPAASYAPVGPFSRLVVAGPAGAVCPRWRVARVTPGCSWIHGSGPLRWRTADRGHSFGCQQDKPSASLVTTNRTSMCIDLHMCLYSCMLLIVFLLGIKLLLLLLIIIIWTR